MDDKEADREDSTDPIERWERTLSHAWELWFAPEIEKRRHAGIIKENFKVYSAQFLQHPNGIEQVFFNEEVRGIAKVKFSKDIRKGDIVYHKDISEIYEIDLPDYLLDFQHFTVIHMADEINISFNFLSGRSRARDLFDLANQFLKTANLSAMKGYEGPAVDNLFSASELISKAELILHRNAAASSKSHGPISSEINKWRKLGNIDSRFVKLFNNLAQQRQAARYGDAEHRPHIPSSENFELVQLMIERGLQRVTRSTELSVNENHE
ncbi:hypothetical protein [Stappia sp.]|uniref:hypothetical protein n=1 Tax=Stappia sp. TaxID=1870903 RepID=UPI0032D97976